MKTEKVIDQQGKVILQPCIEFFLEREKDTSMKDLIMIENATYKWSNWNKAVKLLINKKLSERIEVKYNEK